MGYQKKRKTRNKKPKKHKKFSKKAGVLNTGPLHLLTPLETAHLEDGEVATADVLQNLPGLPQDLPGAPHGDGADRRMQWLRDNDFEALLHDIKNRGKKAWRRDQFKTPELSRSNRQRYLNEIAKQQGLTPGGEWEIIKKKIEVKKKKKKKKK